MTLPSPGFYNTTLQSFFGSMSTSQQEEVWQSFLQNYGITNPSESDATVKAEFVKYSMQMLDRIEYTTSQVIVSPDEVAKRQILFLAFDIVLTLLNHIQNTLGEQSRELIFLGTYQQQYTRMLTRVPLYTPNPIADWQPSTSSASNFTLGFNNISIEEVSQYVVATNSTVTLTNGDINFVISPDHVVLSNGSGTIDTSTVSPTENSFDAQVTATGTAFLNVYNNNLSTINASSLAHGSPNIPSRFIALDLPTPPAAGQDTEDYDNALQANNQISQERGETNVRNQSMISNITANRRTLENKANTVQSNLSSTRDSITQMSDLLTSLLDTINQLGRKITQ